MKFAEIIEPEGGFLNDSNSYFLVIGILYTHITPPSGTGTYYGNSGVLMDQNGNGVDFFKITIIQVSSWSLPMPVWNGSSVVTENYTLYTTAPFIYQKSVMLVPPGYRLSDFGYAIGFWLSPDEVEQMILGTGPFSFEKLRRGAIKI
ncbi:MAG: hypothetical protein QW203_07925 [Thermoplasmatales archaeon]